MRRAAIQTLALAALFLAACDPGTSPVEPGALAPVTPRLALGQELLLCPATQEYSASKTLGILGGSISVDGHRLTLPPGAVLAPTTFTVTAPASDRVELQVHADGHESFQFLVPASITISYQRCGDTPVEPEALAVWHYDEITGLLLELMGGQADPHRRTISFPTSHLSGFIIVN